MIKAEGIAPAQAIRALIEQGAISPGAPLVDYHTTQTVDAATVKRRRPASSSACAW